MSTAFGPGKVILLGEHGVVYGHPALAAPLCIGVTAQAVPHSHCEVELAEPSPSGATQLLKQAFEQVAELAGRPAVKVTLKSELPLSVGLGSSGALSVACAQVLLEAKHGRAADSATVGKLAFEMEKLFHGTPSGVDHTTSAEKALLYYRRTPGEDHGHFERLLVKSSLPLVVAICGARSGTKKTVAELRSRKEIWPQRYTRLFSEIGQLVEEGRAAIEAGDLKSLGDLMNVNHGLLSALGLSSAQLDSAVHQLRSAGALGAKLTGAGGDGGAVIGLFEDPEAAVETLKAAGVHCFVNRIPGVVS